LYRINQIVDIEKRLAAEHSKSLTLAIVEYVGDDKNRFKQLFDVFLNGNYHLSQRAAWALSYVSIKHPQLVKPYFSKLIEMLGEPGKHPAVKRNILRIFETIDIPEKYQAILIDECFKIISDPSQPAAIVAFAITTATNLCKPFPELSRELKLLLNELIIFEHKPAIKVRVKRAMKMLNT